MGFEFSSDDVLLNSESMRDEWFSEDPASSYYNSTEFNILVDDEEFINFKNISDNLLSYCFISEDETDIPTLMAPVSKQITTQSIDPPSWLFNTSWSGSFTDEEDGEINVCYSFTDDNLESKVGENSVNYKEYQAVHSSLGITSISSPIQYEIILSETINSDNRRKILFTKTLEGDKINCVFCNEVGEVTYDFDLTPNN
jgi:hypothetical protein